MQKWMRDRARRRRKKTEPEGAAEQQQRPAPLQPTYPEPEQMKAAAVEEERTAEPEKHAQEPVPVAQSERSVPSRPRKRRRARKPRVEAVPPRGPEVGGEGAPPEAVPGAAVEEEIPTADAQGEPQPKPEPGATPVQAMEEGFPAGGKKTQRVPKGAVVLSIGLPGSGKSTWFKRHGVTPLSSDLLRSLLFDDATEQRHQDLVFSCLRSLLRARLMARMPWNYVDATNLSAKERRHWIRMAREFGYEVHAIYFDVPPETCKARNLRRNRVVPEEVMQRMAAKLKEPTFEEGFAKITVVRVKQKDEEPAV